MYGAAVRPLVERVLAGGSGAMVAYGQTGAGKTHTSTAMQRRAVAGLLAGGAARVAVSFYEVHCTTIMTTIHNTVPVLLLHNTYLVLL